MKRKKVIRWLKKEAKKLPEQTYPAYEKFNRPFFTDAEGNMYTEEMRKEKVPVRMVDRQVVNCPVNHYRRMKCLYDKWGFMAVHAYFRVIGGMIPENASENLLEPQISPEIIK